MVGGDARDVEVVRRRAPRELRTARDVMGQWTDLIRQAAEQRVDGVEADDVLSDPSYWDAIGLYAQLNDAIARFAADGARVQAGGVS